MRYRIHLEPEDVEADNPDEAWDKLKSTWLDRHPILGRIVLVDEHGFPINLESKTLTNKLNSS